MRTTKKLMAAFLAVCMLASTSVVSGFAATTDSEPVSADIFKANEEQMVNWLITAMNYLGK